MPKIYAARYIGSSDSHYEPKTLYHIVISRTTENKFLVRTKNNEGIKIYDTEQDVRNEWSDIQNFGVIDH